MNATTFNFNGKALKDFNIRDIESMTEDAAFILASDRVEFKGHTLYFVDFGGYFGFSVLVFAEGKHIYYCNDYQLHHPGKAAEELKEYYINSLSRKIFTVKELSTVAGYDDFNAKDHYIRNYYPQRFDHYSAFFIGSDKERAARQESIKSMVYSDIAFSYFKDSAPVKKINALFEGLQAAKKQLENDIDFWRSAFLAEMYNHEYCINWQGDFDVISCFANVSGVSDVENINSLFNAARFSEMQITAYMSARTDYIRNANY